MMNNLQMQLSALMRLCTAEAETDRKKAEAEVRRLMKEEFYLPCRDPEVLIRDILLELGAPDHLVGHPYVITAVLLVVEDRTYIDSITFGLYPQIAARHDTTASRVERAIRHLVDAGFKAINMDLIAGLPTDTFDGFRRSLDEIAALRPGNITVHTLALKKGADLFDDRENLSAAGQVSAMVDYANECLREQGYVPYYLYRQKYMSGSFENVGWARDGLDCLYNIYMMEELHTILSLGGGGMNKINLPDGSLERFHNPKFPEQYIQMLPQVLEDKKTLFERMKGSV